MSSEDGSDKLTKNTSEHPDEQAPPIENLQHWNELVEGKQPSPSQSEIRRHFRVTQGSRIKKLRMLEPIVAPKPQFSYESDTKRI